MFCFKDIAEAMFRRAAPFNMAAEQEHYLSNKDNFEILIESINYKTTNIGRDTFSRI